MKQLYKIILVIALLLHVNTINAKINFDRDVNFSIILPPLTATISGGATVCQNTTGVLVTFTGDGGTAPYTFTYTATGVTGNQTISTTGTNNVITLTAPTGTAGIITYSLVSATDSSTPSNNINVNNNSNTAVIKVINLSINAGGNLVICKGNSINLISTISGNEGIPVTYSWTGPNGYSSNLQSPTILNSTTAMSGNYTVTATAGNCQVQDTINIQVLSVGVVNPSLLNGCVTQNVTNSDVGMFLSLPSDTTLINTISINWGDGNIQTLLSTEWSSLITHNYITGNYHITITTTSISNCTSNTSYNSFVGSSPQAATLSLFANQSTGCVPHSTQFTFGVPINNSIGTNYHICFGDNTSCIDYVSGDPIPSNWIASGTISGFNFYTIGHVYTSTSCGNSVNLNGTFYNNVYLPSVITTNPCAAPQPQAGSLISIGVAPTASFTPNPIPNICINTALTLTNTSNLGVTIDPVTFSCTQTAPIYWTVSPNTIGLWTANGLGSNNNHANNELFWTVGSNTPSITFLQPGTYTITLFIKNPCGISQISKQVCVESPLLPQFTLNTNTGCTPLAVTATNTTDLSHVCSALTYAWTVTYASNYCGSGIATWNYTNNTSASSINPSFNFVTPGTYSISVTISGSTCGTVTSPIQTVIVKKPPTVAINTIPDYCGTASISPTAVVNGCSNITTNNPTYSWSFPGATTTTSTAVNPTGINYTTPGNYTVTLSVTNECGTTTDTKSFIVKPMPNATITGGATVCQNATSPVITFTGSGGTPPYSFTYNINSGSSQTIVTTALSNSVTINAPTSTAGTFIYNLVGVQYSTTPSCNQTLISSTTVIVNPTPTITGILNGCIGATLTLTGSASPATTNPWVSANTAVATISSSGVVTGVTAGTTVITYTNSNGCITTATVTINALPIISGTLSVCVGSTTTLIGTATAATSTPWVSSNTSVATVSTTGVVTGVAVGTTIITYTNSNGCQNTVTVSVNPKPIIPAQTATICSGDAFNITPTNSGSTIVPANTTYTWTVATNTNVSGQSVSLNPATSISQSLTNTTNTVQTVVYTVTPTSGAAGNCVGSTFTITVTVNPKPTIAAIIAPAICSGATFTVTPSSTGTNSIPTVTTYSWTTPVSNPVGVVTGGSAQTIGQNFISQTLANATSAPATLTYTVTPKSGTCIGADFTITITVNPIPASLALTNQVYCNGVATSAIAFTNVVTGTTYAWTNSNIAIGLATSGTGNIPIFTPTNTTTNPITATISVIASANGCSRTAETFTITVNPSPVITFSPTAQTICSGDSTTLVTLSSTTTGVTFTWTAAAVAGITGIAPSGTTTIPVQTLTNFTSAPITVTYSASAATNGASACSGALYNYTIIVNPKPAITEVFTPITCSGIAFSVTPTASTLNSIPSGTTYSWLAPTVTGAMTGGVAGSGTSIVGTLNNPTNGVQTATYTVIPSANGCAGTAFTVTVSVNPKPIIPAQTATICSSDAFTITPTNSGSTIVPANTTYTWTVATNTNVSGQSASLSPATSISQSLTNNSNSVQTVVYTVTPTSGAAGNCVGSTFTITVTVNPKPTIPNQFISTCSGTAFTVPLTNSPPSLILPLGTTFTWTVNNPIGISGAINQTSASSAISQILTNATNTPISIIYNVTASSGIIPTNCTNNFTVTVTVNPTPNISNVNTTICSAMGFSVTPTNGSGINVTDIVPFATTYSWPTPISSPAGAVTGGSAGTDVLDTIAQTLSNSSSSPATLTYTIIPKSGTCIGATFTIIVTVNPSPSVTFSPAPQTICSGDSTTLVTLSSTTAGVIFSWTSTTPIGISGIAPSGTTTIPVQTLTNSANAPITITYSAAATTASGATCLGAESNYTIIVNPKPNIVNQITTICNNQSFIINPINGTPSSSTIVPIGTIYTWTIIPNPNITGASSGNGSSISQTLTNISNILQTIVYNVIPSYLNCNGTSFTITVNVNPTPTAIFSISNQTICNNTSSSIINLSSNATGTINYSWICTNPPIGITGLIVSGTTNTIPSQLLVNTTTNPIIITYQVTAEITGAITCSGPPSFYTITVNPTFQATGVISNYNGYGVSVFGGTDGFVHLTLSGGSGVYTYSWTGPNGFIATTQDINGVPAGTYNVSISDGYCSPIILTFVLTQPPELLIQENLAVHTNLLCFGNTNGIIGVTITQGSVAPYTYQILNAAGAIINTISNSNLLNVVFNGLVAGTYSIKVLDANGGIKTITGIVVTQPNTIVITAVTTAITCYGANNASITLTVTGGTPQYQAQWSNLATGLYQNNLSAGDYTILITDANGCQKTIIVNIPQAPIFTVNPISTNISCFGAHDGSINLNLIGGISPLALTWSDGSSAGLIRNNLGPGTYTATISDGTPCYIVRTFTIVEPQLLVLSATTTNALNCTNANSGAINLMVSGGTPPFIYSWNNGTTTEDLSAIPAGNYLVTVTDARECTKTAQYIITRPNPLVVAVNTYTNANCNMHTVSQTFSAVASGGMPPYIYNWSSGSPSGANNQFMTTTLNGLVTLVVTDAIGCSTTYSLNVVMPALGNPTFTTSSIGSTSYGVYSILDPIQFQSTITGSYTSVLWDFGDGTFSNELNPIHTYTNTNDYYLITQTVTYPFGCIYVMHLALTVGKGYLLVVPSAFTPNNNDGINDTLRPVTKGLKNVHLDVYDTWGSLIYSEVGEVLVGWDGKIKGVNSENGNYYVKVSGETFYGTVVTENHPFVLIK